jgi:hypothetical protein
MAKVLPDLQAENAELQARIQELEAKLKANEKRATLRVSKKGCVSLYGFGRFPISLYGNQWGKLWEIQEDVKAFIEANKDKISFAKPEKDDDEDQKTAEAA